MAPKMGPFPTLMWTRVRDRSFFGSVNSPVCGLAISESEVLLVLVVVCLGVTGLYSFQFRGYVVFRKLMLDFFCQCVEEP